jgi:hypothetical protein
MGRRRDELIDQLVEVMKVEQFSCKPSAEQVRTALNITTYESNSRYATCFGTFDLAIDEAWSKYCRSTLGAAAKTPLVVKGNGNSSPRRVVVAVKPPAKIEDPVAEIISKTEAKRKASKKKKKRYLAEKEGPKPESGFETAPREALTNGSGPEVRSSESGSAEDKPDEKLQLVEPELTPEVEIVPRVEEQLETEVEPAPEEKVEVMPQEVEVVPEEAKPEEKVELAIEESKQEQSAKVEFAPSENANVEEASATVVTSEDGSIKVEILMTFKLPKGADGEIMFRIVPVTEKAVTK